MIEACFIAIIGFLAYKWYKSRRNDTPKDPETGKFTNEKD